MLFSDLEIAPSTAALATADADKTLMAVFIDDDDAPVAYCACDHAFAAYAGASLTMIPKGVAEEAAANGDFSKPVLDNVSEIMNICSRLFMNNRTPHLRLDRTYPSPGEVPAEQKCDAGSMAARSDYEVTIPNYGQGRIAFLSS